MSKPQLQNQNPFQSNTSEEVAGVVFETYDEKINIYGDLSIPVDKEGLHKIQLLIQKLETIKTQLTGLNLNECLPDQVQIKKPVIIKNPFGELTSESQR